MNFLEYLFLLFADNADKIWEKVSQNGVDKLKRELFLARRLIVTAIVLPLALLAIGLAIGGFGGEGVAQGFLRTAGFIATVLLVLFWFRAWAYATILVAASQIGHAVVGKVPELDKYKADTFVRWFRGITVWISIACLYAMVVPVWRHLGWSAIAAVCMLGLSGVMTAGWFNGKLPRYVGTLIIVGLLLFSTAVQFHPGFSQALSASAAENLGDLNGWGERKDMMTSTSLAADKAANEADQNLLKQRLDERNRIRERSIKDCKGEFCSPDDRARAATLDQDIQDLREGTYWDKRTGKHKAPTEGLKTTTPSGTSSSSPGSNSKAAELPPPPSVPRQDTQPETPPQTAANTPSPSSGTSKDKVAEEICNKYPEVCR